MIFLTPHVWDTQELNCSMQPVRQEPLCRGPGQRRPKTRLTAPCLFTPQAWPRVFEDELLPRSALPLPLFSADISRSSWPQRHALAAPGNDFKQQSKNANIIRDTQDLYAENRQTMQPTIPPISLEARPPTWKMHLAAERPSSQSSIQNTQTPDHAILAWR